MKSLVCKASTLRVRATPDGADTGQRIAKGDTVSALGESFDRKWVFVTLANVAGWASADYLGTPAAVLDPWPKVPSGLAAIKRLYGEAGNAQCYAGRVQLPESLSLSWSSKEHISAVACHELIEGPLQAAFDALHARELWHLMEDFGGCYNYRAKRGTKAKLSTHCWGIAVDINVKSNPLGAKPKLDARVVKVFEEFGFLWGGRWARPDGMHFQRCTGY